MHEHDEHQCFAHCHGCECGKLEGGYEAWLCNPYFKDGYCPNPVFDRQPQASDFPERAKRRAAALNKP